ALDYKNQVLVKVYNRRALSVDEVVDTVLAHGRRFADRIADTRLLLNKALEAGETLLLEGSQGTMLDVDHGTYPFVTSSNLTAGGAAVGSGIGPNKITRVIGILKAYTTRVGSGPFPTELLDEMGERLRKAGGEVGVTTGRPRRCGWFDAVIGRYAVRVNGITDFFLTKLDVLSGLETVPICVGYEVDGRRVDDMPMTQTDVHHAQPVYEELPGWFEDLSACRTFADLPANARAYVERIEELTGAPVSAIGVGPGRDQTITRDVWRLGPQGGCADDQPRPDHQHRRGHRAGGRGQRGPVRPADEQHRGRGCHGPGQQRCDRPADVARSVPGPVHAGRIGRIR